MTTPEKKEPTAVGAEIDGKTVREVIRVRGIRKVMAEHMHRSLQVSAQLSSSMGIDMTEVINCRKTLNEQYKDKDIHFTFTDLFAKIVAEALKDNPLVNSSIVDNEILIWDDINLGVALDFETRDGSRGLIVPILRNADKKSVVEINQALEELKQKGRDRKIMPDDTMGGTFTLTNTGALGGGGKVPGRATGMASSGTPVINQPEVGIFGTGGYADTPVVVDGQLAIRPIMYCNFTYDHRVLTGADAAMFSGSIYRHMMNPTPLMAV